MTVSAVVSPSTARKLRQIANAITAKPTQFEMQSWAKKTEDCGTTCCIGGYACVQAGISKRQLSADVLFTDHVPARLLKNLPRGEYFDNSGREFVDIKEVAIKALGVSRAQGTALFYTENWGAFEDAFVGAESPKAKALVAAARIEHFIATGA